jgi:hypothetical protein
MLIEPRLRWLGSGREKVEYFKAATTLRLKELPHLAFGRGADKTIRHFPDKLPIGVAADGRTHVFVYLVNRPTPVDFRAFLHRHAELLRALPEWELRLLVPRHMVKATPLYEDAAREEMRTKTCGSSPQRLVSWSVTSPSSRVSSSENEPDDEVSRVVTCASRMAVH